MGRMAEYVKNNSNFLKAEDIPAGKNIPLTISDLDWQKVSDDEPEKPVLRFEGKEKGLVLNKTNSSKIMEVYGDEEAQWVGKPILVHRDVTNYNGKQVPCVRVEVPRETAEEDIPGF